MIVVLFKGFDVMLNGCYLRGDIFGMLINMKFKVLCFIDGSFGIFNFMMLFERIFVFEISIFFLD